MYMGAVSFKAALLGLFITASISSCRLIYSDKLDLIHRLLSSIYFATGLCHPVDIWTEWRYQISYSGCKSSEGIEMWCERGAVQYIVSEGRFGHSPSLEVVCFHPVCVCVAGTLPICPRGPLNFPRALSWEQASYS